MPRSMVEISEIVTRIAAEQAAVDPQAINGNTAFVEDLNFDSLDRVEFMMNLEEAFDLSIPDDLAERVRTVGQACELVAAQFGALRAAAGS